MSQLLNNQVAVVTGAGRGIGRAIAQGYAKAGATVVCVARTEPEIAETAAAIEAAGGRSTAIVCDVTDVHAVNALFSQVEKTYGGLDILVLNAGMDAEYRSIEAGDPAVWTRIVDVNLFGAYYCARAAIPLLKKRDSGLILTMGSGLGHHGRIHQSAYACSKAGLWMLTRILADELADDHISVNEIIPGPVDTSMAGSDSDPNSVFSIAGEWFKRPDDVVPLALFLATHPKPGPTGQSFSLMRRTL
ncbi:SDR family NAD(P)-dependent oxidoreductase [Sulfobacillus harzensis]|uniref:SDR family oxidoreductase n=1 Tax=Sulfobacillus harzensis TaxID=2729629 RepID=A0A7Y0L8H4_9FIRM|nr:SDR family oxidoreductase [Sulfobacillus harzensis]